MLYRSPPTFQHVQLLPGEERATLIGDCLDALNTVWSQFQHEQRDLLLSLGYSQRERMELSIQLAQNLYRSGLSPSFTADRLHRVVTEGELQALFYRLVCGDALLRVPSPSHDHKEDPSHDLVSQVPARRRRIADTSTWRLRRRTLPDTP